MNFLQIVFNTIQARKPLIKLFSVLSLGCVSIIVLRLFIHADRTFLFLLWNFFLAVIPLAISSVMLEMNGQKMKGLWLLLPGVVWMLFYPNAPYVLTDYIHLTCSSDYYLSLDILTITWFAVSSLLAALISLNDVSRILLSRYKQKRVTIMVLGLSLLTGFGIYLGRYLRFNSWDVLQQPHHIMWQVSERVVNPAEHPRTWMVTVGFGVLLFIVYQAIKMMGKEFADPVKMKTE